MFKITVILYHIELKEGRNIHMSLKDIVASIIYNFNYSGPFKSKLHVMSINDTVQSLCNSSASLVRFGDGEFKLISGKDISNQRFSSELGQRLLKILNSDSDSLLVALPDIFEGMDQFVPSSRRFWKEHLLFHRQNYFKYCKPGLYANSFISRPYIMYADKQKQAKVFQSISKLWKNADIIFVEGTISHNAVDNDLFSNAKSIRRIIGPSENAYEKYDDLLNECLKQPKSTLILVTLGAAGKVLTYDLWKNGYHVLDIGSLDMEYGWYIEGATSKCRVPKHEICTFEENIAAGYNEYLSQIISVI